MKKIILISSLLLTFTAFSQWTQLGNNIDGEATDDQSGNSVSLSADGSIVAIGSRLNDENGTDSGLVRVYENINGIWTQLDNDINGEATGDESGNSLSLSDDGSILAIGAIFNDDKGTDSGHVRVFSFDGTDWSQLGNDIDGEEAGDYFGKDVSLNGDGSTLAIGAIGTNSGYVRILNFDGTNWTQIGTDINGEATDDNFGSSVSLSTNGSIVAIGASGNDANGSNSGHARVYSFNGTDWTQLGNDIDGETASDLSGTSIGLNADGTIIAIGASGNDGNGNKSGHVRVYSFDDTVWTQVGSDIDGEAASDLSGRSISLNSDGTIVAIGALFNNGNGTLSGHVRVYENVEDVWTQVGSDIDGEAASNLSGSSVSLSADGTTVAIGAVGNNNFTGHVRIFNFANLEEYTLIPDRNFETALEALGYDNISGDGQVPTELIDGVTELTLNDQSIEDITGIEDFVALNSLNLSNIDITSIDISKNTFLENLQISDCSTLETMVFGDNEALIDLSITGTLIEHLDLSPFQFLTEINVSSNNLSYLNVKTGKTEFLNNFNAKNNPNLSCIIVDFLSVSANWVDDVDDGVIFSTTYCRYTTIPDANFETALENLGYDDISGDGQVPTALIEEITELDISNSTISVISGIGDFKSLETLDCYNNTLTDLDLSENENLVALNARSNGLSSITISNSPNLKELTVNNNSLTTIDITQNTLLERFIAYSNSLSTIDISQNTALTFLNIYDNSLTDLEVTNNLEIEELYANDNAIAALDLTKNQKLIYLYVSNNPISGYVDLSYNISLEELEIDNCNLSGLNLKNGNNDALYYIEASQNSNLSCIQVDNLENANAMINNGWSIDNHASVSEDCEYFIYVSPAIILEGAFETATGTIVMHDDLRINAVLPTTSPYADAITCDSVIFDTTGENAVVDWVEVQLRDATDVSQIITSTSALLVRNGNIVATDGVSDISFEESYDNYYVAISHRNHLTIASNTAYALNGTTTTVDFTNTTNVTGGSAALVSLGDGLNAIPLGDIDENGQIQNTDSNAVVTQIGISGYSTYDVDLNGQVQNSDVNVILQNVGKGEQVNTSAQE